MSTLRLDWTVRLNTYIVVSARIIQLLECRVEQGKKGGRRDEVRKELNPLPMLRHVASMYWIVKRF